MDENERLARIALVSRRFNQLQGLRLVAIGLGFAVPFAGFLAIGARSEDALYLAFGASFVMFIAGMVWADRFYNQAFGRVKHGGRDGAMTGFLVGIGFVIVSMFERHIISEHTMASVFVVFVNTFTWTALREWRWLRHHLLGALAGVLGIVLQLKAPTPADVPAAIAASFVLIGVVSVPLGFIDHQLLVSAMRQTGDTTAPQPE